MAKYYIHGDHVSSECLDGYFQLTDTNTNNNAPQYTYHQPIVDSQAFNDLSDLIFDLPSPIFRNRSLKQILENDPDCNPRDKQVIVTATENAEYVYMFNSCLWHVNENREIQCYIKNDSTAHIANIMLPGTLWSLWAIARNKPSHHCSVIDIPELDGCVLIFGHSGAGKTSIAYGLATAGACIRSDDVATLHFAKDQIECDSGSTVLRSRDEHNITSNHIHYHGQSDDNRYLYTAKPISTKKNRVLAVIMPEIRRDVSDITLEHMSSTEALLKLMKVPREYGLFSDDFFKLRVNELTRLVNKVPTLRAKLPYQERNLNVEGSVLKQLIIESVQ